MIGRRGQELHYLLPLQQSRPAVLQELFAKLDTTKCSLGIQQYGLTSCSMEEVSTTLHGLLYCIAASTCLIIHDGCGQLIMLLRHDCFNVVITLHKYYFNIISQRSNLGYCNFGRYLSI